jgi:hypothetical protein
MDDAGNLACTHSAHATSSGADFRVTPGFAIAQFCQNSVIHMPQPFVPQLLSFVSESFLSSCSECKAFTTSLDDISGLPRDLHCRISRIFRTHCSSPTRILQYIISLPIFTCPSKKYADRLYLSIMESEIRLAPKVGTYKTFSNLIRSSSSIVPILQNSMDSPFLTIILRGGES